MIKPFSSTSILLLVILSISLLICNNVNGMHPAASPSHPQHASAGSGTSHTQPIYGSNDENSDEFVFKALGGRVEVDKNMNTYTLKNKQASIQAKVPFKVVFEGNEIKYFEMKPLKIESKELFEIGFNGINRTHLGLIFTYLNTPTSVTLNGTYGSGFCHFNGKIYAFYRENKQILKIEDQTADLRTYFAEDQLFPFVHLFGEGTKVKMQKGTPPFLEEIEYEIGKHYPRIGEFLFRSFAAKMAEMENKYTFTLKDSSALLESNQPFVIYSAKKIQYFEFVLKVKRSQKPFEIKLAGEKDSTDNYVYKLEAEINEPFGCGLFYRDDGKIFRFYKQHDKISIFDITKDWHKFKKDELWPTVSLEGKGTKVKMQKEGTPPTVEELEHEIRKAAETSGDSDNNDELMFHPVHNPNVEVENNKNTIIITLKDSFHILRSDKDKPLIIPPQKKIEYFEFKLLAKGSNESLYFGLESVDKKKNGYEPKMKISRGFDETEINDFFGCGLFNQDGKIFSFYKKNNQIFVDDITEAKHRFEQRGFAPFVTLSGIGTKVEMQKGTPPTVEELEQEIRKLYPAPAETSAVSADIGEFLFRPYNAKKFEMENMDTFTLKDSFALLESNKPFIISPEKKIQYFELKLLKKGRWSGKQPLEIILQGTDKDDTYSYAEEMEAEKNDSFGCGLFNHEGKIFRFYKKNNEISIIDKINKLNKFEMGGLWPAIYLEYQGTKVKIQEGTPPTVAELEHEISENELIFHPMHNQNVVVEVNEEDVNKIIITLRVSSATLRSDKPLIISAQKKIQYFELVLLKKGSEKPFEIGMGQKYIKYANPLKSYSSEEIEINHSLGWGLFNHDEKIFLFYKKNNQILVNDITEDKQKFEKSGFTPFVKLNGRGTKVKMQKGTPPTVEELEQEIRKHYPAAAGETPAVSAGETPTVSAGETPAVSHGITHQQAETSATVSHGITHQQAETSATVSHGITHQQAETSATVSHGITHQQAETSATVSHGITHQQAETSAAVSHGITHQQAETSAAVSHGITHQQAETSAAVSHGITHQQAETSAAVSHGITHQQAETSATVSHGITHQQAETSAAVSHGITHQQAETSATVSQGIIHQHHPKNNDEFIFQPQDNAKVKVENENTFILKDSSDSIGSNTPFIISSDKKIQYFEFRLLSTMSEKPVKIDLQGIDKEKIYSYKPEVVIGDSIGCGLFNHDGKIFVFYKKKNQKLNQILMVYDITKDKHKFEKSGFRPEINLVGKGTEVEMQKRTPPTVEEIEHEMRKFEPLYQKLHDDDDDDEWKVKVENMDTFTLKGSMAIIRSNEPFIICTSPAEKEIQYSEFKLLAKESQKLFKIGLESIDKDDFGNPLRYSHESAVEIDETFGCGLYNRDGKIFVFYKKNNHIQIVNDITEDLPKFVNILKLKVFLYGKGTKVKMETENAPSEEELEKEIAKKHQGVTSGASHGTPHHHKA